MVHQFVIDNEDEMQETARHDFHNEVTSPSRVTLAIPIDGLAGRNERSKPRVRVWMRDVCGELFS